MSTRYSPYRIPAKIFKQVTADMSKAIAVEMSESYAEEMGLDIETAQNIFLQIIDDLITTNLNNPPKKLPITNVKLPEIPYVPWLNYDSDKDVKFNLANFAKESYKSPKKAKLNLVNFAKDDEE